MIGSTLSQRYSLQGLLADGPIFSVYLARDLGSGRDQCVRIIKPPFSREPSFLAALGRAIEKYKPYAGGQVEGILSIADDGGTAFLVGDVTRGPTLQDRIRKLAPFSVPLSTQIGYSLCRALESLHRAKLAHGDVSTANVIMMANDDVRLQLAGIWESYGSSSAGALVLPAMAPYMAPEISRGGTPSPASDVYAVGVILYELLTGRLPYYGESPAEQAFQHRDLPTPSVRAINPSVPQYLEEVVLKAMAKEPAARYPSAIEMGADLRAQIEALRFGKTLKWSAPATPGAAPSKRAVEPGPVAPRMSAIRDQDDEDTRSKRRTERDVPVWMLVVASVLATMVLSLVGIWFFFNLSKPRLIRVPDIKNLSQTEARSMLENLNLELRVKSREPNDKVEPDRVVDVDPEPGQQVREGGRVYVVLSAGSRYVEVPDVSGQTMDKAKSVLEGLGLMLDPLTDEKPSDTVPLGDIVETLPPARSKTQRGSRIKLIVSSGLVAAPETVGKQYTYALKVTVKDVPRDVRVRIDINDVRSTRTIYDERRSAGEVIELDAKGYGERATFRIYYDDELVKEIEQTAGSAHE